MDFIEKKIDKLGRIVLPIEFREKIGLYNETKALVSLKEDCICICSNEIHCALCKSKIEKNSIVRLCEACIEKVKKL